MAGRAGGREAVEYMEVKLQSGKLIIVEEGRLEEVWKLKGFLTAEEMAEVEAAVDRAEKSFAKK